MLPGEHDELVFRFRRTVRRYFASFNEMPSEAVWGQVTSLAEADVREEEEEGNVACCGMREVPSENVACCGMREVPSSRVACCGMRDLPSENLVAIYGMRVVPSGKVACCGMRDV